MKKRPLMFLLVGAFLLAGCDKPRDKEKVQIMYKYSQIEEVINLTELEELKNKITDKENFVLVSYADYTCSCWSVFRDHVLRNYVQTKKIPIYVIETELLDGDYRGLPIRKDLTNTPVIGIYEEGVYKFGIDYKTKSDIFIERDKFNAWMGARIKDPLMTYITLDEVNNLISGNESFLLNWSYSICPDCVALDKKFMPNYIKSLKKAPKMPYYIIESKPLRDAGTWLDSKDIYGLSDKFNETSGYATGYVPTLQIIKPDGNGATYLENGNISPLIFDMLVFQNDQLEKVGDIYKIKDSYYDGVRAKTYLGDYESEIGKVINPEDVRELEYGGQTYIVFQPGARYNLHANYATKFFDYYWR
ncbi:MAG: hypothetical protein ACOX3C_05280 [Bacilli bacterium]|jgi:hypothetical protein